MFFKKLKKSLIILTFFCNQLLFITANAYAQSISLIVDSEIEHYLLELSKPLMKAANLDTNSISFYIVNDDSINAFVTKGENIFVNSGLIAKSDDPALLAGVMAHEIGHIAGRHIAVSDEAVSGVNNVLILSYIAGIAAALAASSGDAASALILGGSHVAQRSALKYTRNHEESADQMALNFLQYANYSADGLLRLMQIIKGYERSFEENIDQYAITHPISINRINHIANYIEGNPNDFQINANLQHKAKMVKAKLDGFLIDTNEALNYYKCGQIQCIYARSIAYYRKNQINKSLKLIDNLINLEPENGYFYELKGQVLFENNDVKGSILNYKKALNLIKLDKSIIRILYANSILTLNDNSQVAITDAIDNLILARIKQKNNWKIYYLLAKAYKQKNDDAKSLIYLGYYNLFTENFDQAIKNANDAKEKFDLNEKEILLADDLINIAEDYKKEK